MSISPIPSLNEPGPSSAVFSFFLDEEETQEASSNQELSLKDRIKLLADRLGYKTYSVFNPPYPMPLELPEAQYEVDKKKFFAKKPDSYEEAKQKHWWLMDVSQRKIIEEYADPELRKEKAQEYADRTGFPSLEQGRKEWLVLVFCEQEIHDLYKKEPKYLRMPIKNRLWVIRGFNKSILAEHRQKWDQLSPSEKAGKIFGKRWKYEAAAGVSTATVCFFLCHGIYQQLQSPQQLSTS